MKVGRSALQTEFKGRLNTASPTYFNNHFYVVTTNSLYKINTSGKITKTITIPNYENYYLSPSISATGLIIFGQNVYDTSGKLLWSFTPENQQDAAIDNKQNMIFPYAYPPELGVYAENLASINLITKKTNWTLPVNHEILIPAVIGKDGTIYVAGTKLTAIGQKSSP